MTAAEQGAAVVNVSPDMSRQEREAAFHDTNVTYDVRKPTEKYYSIFQRADEHFMRAVLATAGNGPVLDYGCGPGQTALALARRGIKVVGIDISPQSIEVAARNAREEGLEELTEFRVMDAETLEFPDGTFKVVYGKAIIHHLELDRAFAEIGRVTDRDGAAIFLEALGHNPIVNLYRRLTPSMRTPDEHPLTAGDMEVARQHFAEVNLEYFYLTAIAAAPLRSTPVFEPVLHALEALDDLIFRSPRTRYLAWCALMELRRPVRRG